MRIDHNTQQISWTLSGSWTLHKRQGELHAVTLALKEVAGEHSGGNQAAVVLDVLNDYEIRNKLGYMVMDNVGSNDTLITIVGTSLNDERVSYNAIQRRLRCNGHAINLAVQVFLFEKRVNDSEYLGNKLSDI